MTTQKFDFLLSIGGACKTRYQTERILKARRLNWNHETFFFDWLMCGGLPGVAKIIDSGFSIAASDMACEPLYQGGDYVPLHKPSGFRFLHEFHFDAEARKNFDIALSIMNSGMSTFIEKFAYLGDKTDALLKSDMNVALVYHGQADAAKIEHIFSVLRAKYGKSFTLISVNQIGTDIPVVADGVISLMVDDSSVLGAPNEWQGCDSSWDAAFADIQTA